jgi:hypothetical protein
LPSSRSACCSGWRAPPWPRGSFNRCSSTSGQWIPRVYGGVTVLFSVVSAVACLVPSLRAARVDPLVALREG